MDTRRDFAALEARRMQAAALFRRDQSPAEVGRVLGVSRQNASVWHQRWTAHGIKGLKGAGRAGRRPKLPRERFKEVARALLRGPRAYGYTTEFWTLERIARVITKTCQVSYHPGHVWRLLGQLGWSCQRPMRRARQRDEAAIARWCRDTWPRIKKKRHG